MDNIKYIPVVKIRHSYELSVEDFKKIILDIPKEYIYPCLLWHENYFNKFKYPFTVYSFKECSGLDDEFEKLKSCKNNNVNIHRYNIVRIIYHIITKLPSKKSTLVFNYIFEDMFDMLHMNNKYTNDIDYVLNLYCELEDKYMLNKLHDKNAPSLSEEAYLDIVKEKEKILDDNYELLRFTDELYYDAILIDKGFILKYLYKCGYQFKNEVKGISYELATNVDSGNEKKRVKVKISSKLFAGLEIEEAEKNLRKHKYNKAVRAFIYHKKLSLNKTEIGQLLLDSDCEQKTLIKRVTSLIEDAEKRYNFDFCD